MLKQTARAALAIYLVWNVLEYVLHGVILPPTYRATAQLWRPLEEWKFGVGQIVIALSAVTFSLLYARLIGNKCMRTGLCYGLLFGIMAAAAAGYGTYSVRPIPHHLALTLFLAKLLKMTLGGLILGRIVRSKSEMLSESP